MSDNDKARKILIASFLGWALDASSSSGVMLRATENKLECYAFGQIDPFRELVVA